MRKRALIFFVLLNLAGSAGYGAHVYNDVSARITKAIVSYLIAKDPVYSGKKIEVSYKYADRVFGDLKARKGNITFTIAELYPDFMPVGNIIVPIHVVVDGVPKEKIFLRTKVSVFDRIVVAKRRLKRGEVITSAEAGIEERDIAALNPKVIRDMSAVNGKEVKTFIPGGNPVYDWMIRERPLVKKSEKIKITTGSENVIVAVAGLSLEDGDLGSEVKVKNLASGKELIGVVIGTGEVEIK